MGKEFAERNGEVDGKVDDRKAGGNRADSDSTSTASAGSGDGGRAGGRAGNGDTAGNKTEKEVVPQVVTVDNEEERKREERNAKRRERYAKQKAENGQSVKPRKVNQTKKQNNEPPFDREQINGLIVGLSAIIASRPNCEQWLLSESEVDAITKPLCAIIAESEKLEVIAQNSNQIALGVACVSVFAPRLLVTVQKAKEEKEKKKDVRKVEQTKADIERLNRDNNKRDAVNDKKSDNVLPFYGVPIS